MVKGHTVTFDVTCDKCKQIVLFSHQGSETFFREDLVEELMEKAQKATQSISSKEPSKYHRDIKGASVDVYDVLNAWSVTNPAVQHAVKKLLQPGSRGHKDKLTDLKEALQSIERAIELESYYEN